ncbi:MAG: hypothetical protein D6722_01815 [Bacteroidetes bacterium]|nr:MAG: hypothetical protein D6722_01815 [Bacteroidota bacterium]
MANRITYRWLRLIHRYSGLTLMTFLLMYFVTGWLMVHEQWLDHPEGISTDSKQYFPYPEGISDAELADQIAATFSLEGRTEAIRHWDNGHILLEYEHPATYQRVIVMPDRDSLQLRVVDTGSRGLIHGLHRTHRYQGGWLYVAMALAMDLTGLALLLFVATGIWLWLILIPHKGWGIIMLSLGTAFTLWTIVTLWTH